MSRNDRYEYKDWKGFGIRAKIYRKRIGMTKEKFAELINRSDNYVYELERGNTGCSVHTLHQISKTLKVSTDKLLYGEEDDMEKEYSEKEIINNIIEACNPDEIKAIKDIVVAAFPHLEDIVKKKKR